MRKVLLLRSGGKALPGVDAVVTHEIHPGPVGIAEALDFDPGGAWLLVTSRTTVEVLSADRGDALFGRPFSLQAAAGPETARAMKDAGAADVLVPSLPGAAGLVEALEPHVSATRVLWPRGSDADPAGLDPLVRAGALLTAPVVYEKIPASLPLPVLDAFRHGDYGAVAVSSLAALDVFLEALGAPGPAALPPVLWGVLGPETARSLQARGFPAPHVPARARLADLVAELQQ